MSEAGTNTTSETDDLNPRSPFDQDAWQKRLEQARLKRQKVIAERDGDCEAHPRPAAKPPGEARRRGTAGALRRPLLHRRLTVTLGDYVARPVLMFLAGVGFGVGMILGLGMLADAGASRLVQPASATLSTEARVTPPESGPVPTVEQDVVGPLPAEVQVADIAPETEDPFVALDAPKLPLAITNVVYMRAGIEPERAQTLRSLPQVPPVADLSSPWAQKPRVFVHAPSGLSRERMNAYVKNIEDAGADVARIGRESFRVSTTHLRYYSDATADEAAALALRLGIEARDFSGQPGPTSRIEVWVAGRPKQTDPEEPEPSGFFARFFSRL